MCFQLWSDTFCPPIVVSLRQTNKYCVVVLFFFPGSCTFDEGFSQCDYQQDPYDDFDWTHINTQEVLYVSPDLPQGEIPFLLSLLSAS